MGRTRSEGARGYVDSRRPPRLSEAERERRAKRAREVLVPAAERWVGKVGFEEAEAALERHKDHITDPKRLAGWLRWSPIAVKMRGSPAEKRKRRRKE